MKRIRIYTGQKLRNFDGCDYIEAEVNDADEVTAFYAYRAPYCKFGIPSYERKWANIVAAVMDIKRTDIYDREALNALKEYADDMRYDKTESNRPEWYGLYKCDRCGVWFTNYDDDDFGTADEVLCPDCAKDAEE